MALSLFSFRIAIICYLKLSALKIQVKKLYLDREFFSVAVIGWLQALDIPLTHIADVS